MTTMQHKLLRVRHIALAQLAATNIARAYGPSLVGLTSEDTVIFTRLRRWKSARGGTAYYRNLNA
jgi:hypothetical protein